MTKCTAEKKKINKTKYIQRLNWSINLIQPAITQLYLTVEKWFTLCLKKRRHSILFNFLLNENYDLYDKPTIYHNIIQPHKFNINAIIFIYDDIKLTDFIHIKNTHHTHNVDFSLKQIYIQLLMINCFCIALRPNPNHRNFFLF